jgi:hypothetical protein
MIKLQNIFLILFSIIFYIIGEEFRDDSCIACQIGIIIAVDSIKSNSVDSFYNVTVLFDKGRKIKVNNFLYSVGDSVLVDNKYSFFKGCGYIVSSWKK